VPVVIILAALAILGGIVVVAMGRGGELARQAVDEPSVADFETGADVAQYRPPPALLGYHAGATEYALLLAGRALADRDAEIAWLRSRLSELQPEGERQDGELRDLPNPDSVAAAPGDEPEPGWPAHPEDSVARQAEAALGQRVAKAESVTQGGEAARSGDRAGDTA
jgi:hypothetical protein